MAEKIIDIEQLAQDQHNFNKGSEQGQELMERSFKEMGAGRSILIDRNGNIIAGNKSQKAAIAAGIKKVRMAAEERIVGLKNERQQLTEKIGKNYLADILRAVNMIKEGMTEKKSKLAKVDSALTSIESILQRVSE